MFGLLLAACANINKQSDDKSSKRAVILGHLDSAQNKYALDNAAVSRTALYQFVTNSLDRIFSLMSKL